MTTYHLPVLPAEVAQLAAGRVRAVDGTVGGGGHAAILLMAGLEVLAIDRDHEALSAARTRLGEDRITWLEGRFAAATSLQAIGAFQPDLILLDLGVSSAQIDRDQRGFSFRPDVALDMRMTGGAGASAADLLNRLPEDELAQVFREFGDEPRGRRLAATVARRRGRRPLATSDDLVNAIRQALGPRTGPADFARLFQAVRIAVNRELAELETALPSLLEALRPGGLLAVISYHSGEDRAVKTHFRAWERSCICPPRQPICTCRGRSLGRAVPRKAIVPQAAEIAANPRARSARLRVFRKSDGS